MALPLIALTGSPNSGKTALFNALTGRHQKVANYPGVTVEKKEGFLKTGSGKSLRVLDLPGTHSLVPKSLDEQVAFDVLLRPQSGESPDILICVADAANLERSLSFVLELRALGKPVVLALNMIDLARQRGLELDLEILEAELGLPVVPTVAIKKNGITQLLRVVEKMIEEIAPPNPAAKPWRPATGSEVRARFNEVDRVLKLAVRTKVKHSVTTEKIDRIVLHPILGYVLLFVVMAALFQAVFTWAHPAMDAIQAGVGWVGETQKGSQDPGNDEEAGRPAKVYFTRLHVRYNRKAFPQDLFFEETANTGNFQTRYIITHPSTGDLSCAAGKKYQGDLLEKRGDELKMLTYLTGKSYKDWDITDSYAAAALKLSKEQPRRVDDMLIAGISIAGLLSMLGLRIRNHDKHQKYPYIVTWRGKGRGSKLSWSRFASFKR